MRGSDKRDVECPVVRLQRHEIVAEHQIHRDGAEQIMVDRGVLQIHKLAAIALRERQRLAASVVRIL